MLKSQRDEPGLLVFAALWTLPLASLRHNGSHLKRRCLGLKRLKAFTRLRIDALCLLTLVVLGP